MMHLWRHVGVFKHCKKKMHDIVLLMLPDQIEGNCHCFLKFFHQMHNHLICSLIVPQRMEL